MTIYTYIQNMYFRFQTDSGSVLLAYHFSHKLCSQFSRHLLKFNILLLKFSTQQSPITLRQTPYIISHIMIYLYSIQYEFLAHFDPKNFKAKLCYFHFCVIQLFSADTTKCTKTMIFFLFCPGKYEKHYSHIGKSFMKLLFLQNMGRTCCVH